MRFDVWAPRPERVEVHADGSRFPMVRGDRGRWSAEVPAAGPGTRYGFVLDGEGPFPDPRSRHQPDGPHGLSQVVDTGAFAWTDGGWRAPELADGVVYELHIGTFTPEGTFAAAARRLDALAELGITHVELMPVATFPGRHGWGYDGVDLFAPHPAYGGPEGLAAFVDAAHRRGLAVLLDVVYNHLGPDGNYLGRFGPYFTDAHTTPWGEAVNLDRADSDQVRRFFIDNALFWLDEYHLDGLRIDAVHAMADFSAIHFLEQLAAEVRAMEASSGRRLVLIAEDNRNDPRVVRRRERGGWGLDAQWSDDFHHALHVALTAERDGYYLDFEGLGDLAAAIEGPFVYDGRYSPFRRAIHGAPPMGLPAGRFVVSLQTHDQVGNRAVGGRIAHLVSPGRARIGAALMLLSPYVPMLFQGEEWGASSPFLFFTDHQDPALADAVRRGRREEFRAFGWEGDALPDPQAEETFTRSRLDWDERDLPKHARMLQWYRDLIGLRARTPGIGGLHSLPARARFDAAEQWLVMDRGPLSVAANIAGVPRRLPAGGDVALASDAPLEQDADHVVLPPESAVVLARPGA